MRHTSDKRRTIIKNVAVGLWALLDRLLESPIVLPVLHQILLVLQRFAASVLFELLLLIPPDI